MRALGGGGASFRRANDTHQCTTLLAESADHARALVADIVMHSIVKNKALKIGGLLLFSPHTMQAPLT